MNEAEIQEELKAQAARIKAVSGVCSQCGRMPLGGCVTGIVDSLDQAHAFCDYNCLAKWNMARGLTACGEVVARDLLWPDDVKCPSCQGQCHDSRRINDGAGWSERAYKCKDCECEFTHFTK